MCENCSDPFALPTNPTVINGVDGESAFMYVASADDASGTNFNYPYDVTQPYRAFVSTNTEIQSPVLSNFTGQFIKVIGVDGTNGTNGRFGGICYEYQFGATAFVGDPGAGYLNFNNISLASTTILSVSYYDVNNTVLDTAIRDFMNSTSTLPGFVRVTSKTDASKYADFQISSFVEPGVHFQITLSNTANSSITPFVQDDLVLLTFSKTGDKGDTGSVWRNGSGAPSNGLGVNGDYYLDTATENVYFKAAGAYTIITNIKGTAGTNGTNGTNGLGYKATSLSNRTTAASGSFTFVTVEAANTLAYTAGARVRAAIIAGAGTGEWMEGIVTSYSGTNLIFTADLTSVVASNGTAWNINLAGNPGATGASSGLQSTIVTITSAQIKTIIATPVTVLAAPGVGKAYDIISVMGSLDFVSAAYTNDQTLHIQGASSGALYAILDNNTLLIAVADKVTKLTNAQEQEDIDLNEALEIQGQGGSESAVGDSNIKLHIVYRIITI